MKARSSLVYVMFDTSRLFSRLNIRAQPPFPTVSARIFGGWLLSKHVGYVVPAPPLGRGRVTEDRPRPLQMRTMPIVGYDRWGHGRTGVRSRPRRPQKVALRPCKGAGPTWCRIYSLHGTQTANSTRVRGTGPMARLMVPCSGRYFHVVQCSPRSGLGEE